MKIGRSRIRHRTVLRGKICIDGDTALLNERELGAYLPHAHSLFRGSAVCRVSKVSGHYR